MARLIDDAADREKVTAMIVAPAGAARPRATMPRRSLRRLSGDAFVVLETACEGLFRFEEAGGRGVPVRVRLNYRHPLALPAGCILLVTFPFLALRAAIVPVLRWRQRRNALSHNAMMMRKRP